MIIGLGIDVGGTFTDAVLINMGTRKILCSAKSRTTNQDLSLGIANAIDKLEKSHVRRISLVSLSTTLATNAIVEGIRRPVASILIGYRKEHCPAEFLNDAFFISGGHNVKGEEVAPLDEEEVLKIIEKTKDGVQAYAVAGYFSARNPDHEIRVKELLGRKTNIPVICGHEISLRLNAAVRATTTILNAHLIPIIKTLLVSVRAVLSGFGVEAPLMVVKGDGTLVTEEIALERPIETVLSGPAASVIGAKHLVNSIESMRAFVVDVGGTTSDITFIENGTARINPGGVQIGQWQTNVQAIDTLTIGLGGDSHIHWDGNGNLAIGPRRVIPLSILARQFRTVTEELARFAQGTSHPTGYPQTDYWIAHERKGTQNLTPTQKELLSLLHGRPRSIVQIGQDFGLYPTLVLGLLQPLEKSGLVQRSGFTLTDIFHLKGHYSKGNRETAEHAASILAGQMELAIEDLCIRVRELFNVTLGLAVLRRVTKDDHDYYGGMQNCPQCQTIWDNFFAEKERDGIGASRGGFDVQIKLDDPIIGLGAPAYRLIPPLAEKFGTRSIVPPHAEVANALGAITGVVMIIAEMTLIPDEKGRVHLFSQNRRATYDTPEEADRAAKRLLRETLVKEAKRAGADQARVELKEYSKRATTRFGDILVEKVIKGRAIGTPTINRSHKE